jgi:hypothetical protein
MALGVTLPSDCYELDFPPLIRVAFMWDRGGSDGRVVLDTDVSLPKGSYMHGWEVDCAAFGVQVPVPRFQCYLSMAPREGNQCRVTHFDEMGE